MNTTTKSTKQHVDSANEKTIEIAAASASASTPAWVGDADAKILEWKHDKVNDKPCIRVLFGVVSGPLRGRRIDWCGWLTPRAIDRTLQQLAAGGYQGGTLRTLDGFGSCFVSLRIEAEPGSGAASRTLFPRVAWVNRIRTLDKAKGLSGDELDDLDELVAKRAAT